MLNKKTGLLLINLGSPDDASVPAVRRYLNEFLMDPYVVDIPWIARCMLVKGIILRTRPKNSAHAYQQIWTKEGSPLITNSIALKNTIASQHPDMTVELSMRYGKLSIAIALDKLMQQNIEHLIVLPLFPQYSQAATESAIQAFKKAFKKYKTQPTVNIITDFHDDPGFINAYSNRINNHLSQHPNDFLLMSYHGLPVRQDKGYSKQCYDTSALIAKQLHLDPNHYTVSFQSRLGRTPWITPYTDDMLLILRDKGITNLAVACPSFVADCLETLEEIGMRAKEQWLQLGGKRFTLIPCLNEHGIPLPIKN